MTSVSNSKGLALLSLGFLMRVRITAARSPPVLNPISRNFARYHCGSYVVLSGYLHPREQLIEAAVGVADAFPSARGVADHLGQLTLWELTAAGRKGGNPRPRIPSERKELANTLRGYCAIGADLEAASS